MVKLYTIGFTQTSAEDFFENIKKNKIEKLIDVRLNNISQLAGFAKRHDLEYFVEKICNAQYLHIPELAPTKEMLDPYKKGQVSWSNYEAAFVDLMQRRSIEKKFTETLFQNSCLLCSEKEPHHCHRRLVVDYLNTKWGSTLEVKHLV